MTDINTLTQKIPWTPISQPSGNFSTHYLYRHTAYEMRSARTTFYIIFLLLFLTVGSCLLLFLVYGEPVYRGANPAFSTETFWSDLFCHGLSITFILFSSITLLSNKEITVSGHDKSINIVEKGVFFRSEKSASFHDVRALQLMQELSSDDDDYWTYEVNLVLNDFTRVALLAHGGAKDIKRSARQLAAFINKPLVDNISA